MTKSATRVAADKVTFTQAEVTSAVALKAPIASPSFTGNVGIGVTPETWSSNNPALQIGSGGVLYSHVSNGTRVSLQGNAYVNSSNADAYITTNEASQHIQEDGTHLFKVAPSGTADAAISWTTPLTITNDGRGLSEFTAKAWCKFAAQGSSNLIYGHNVSSVSYVATGHYRIGFTNSLTYNYSAQMMCMDNGGRNTTFKSGEFEQSYCGVFISNMSQIGTNSAVACFTAFGE